VELVDALLEAQAAIARAVSPTERELQHRRFRGADLELEGIVLDTYGIRDNQARDEIEGMILE
jgi:hypothetical protein